MLAAGETSFHISSENYLALCLTYYYLGAGASVRIQIEMIPSHHIFVPKSIFNRLLKPHLKRYFALDRNFNFVDA